MLAFFINAGYGQEFRFYKGENVLGELMYGLSDEHGLEVTLLKWRAHYEYEITQFGQPVGVVSEDGRNFYFINLLGERVSTFTFPESAVIEDMRMMYDGDAKITYSLTKANRKTSLYRYYLDEDCACDPRPYYPCPSRFPMDTSNASEEVKQVQQMQFILEFYTLDSALTYCNELIDANGREPQYHFYKAWLLNQAFTVSHDRYLEVNYDDEFPAHIWDELIRLRDKGLIQEDEKLQMYLAQYNSIQREIQKLESRPTWLESNLKDVEKYVLNYNDYISVQTLGKLDDWYLEENYEIRIRSYNQAIDALSEVEEYEKQEEIVLLTKAWQNRILDEFYYERIYSNSTILPYESIYIRNERELGKSPNLYTLFKHEKVGPTLRVNGTLRNDQIGAGLGLNFGVLTRINKVWTTEISAGIGYNHFFINDSYGEFYLDFTFDPVGWIEIRMCPSILTNYDGITGVGFLPTAGLRIWNVYLGYGYNFANKSKFGAVQGHSFGLSYGFSIINTSSFIEKEDGFEF